LLHGADRIPRFGHTRHHQHGSRDPLCVDHWHPHSSAREYERGTRGADGLCRRMGSVQSCGTVRPGKPKHNTLPPRPVRLPPLLDTRQQSTLALPTDPTVFILDGGDGTRPPPPIITTGACVFQHHTVTCGLPPRGRPLAAFATCTQGAGVARRSHLAASRRHPQGALPLKRPHWVVKQYCPLCPNGPPETEVSKAATH